MKSADQLIKSLLSEMENLSRKVTDGEPHGWEGSQRRLWLAREAREFLAANNAPVTPDKGAV